MKTSFTFFILFLALTCKATYIDFEAASDWSIINKNRSILIKDVTLPTSVHTALCRNGLIPDPYYRFNDIELRWIAFDDGWVFERDLSIDNASMLNNYQVNLILKGVDTIANVYLNGYYVQFTDNQFRDYTIENLNSKLRIGKNKLEIKFLSAFTYARKMASIYPYRVPPECWDAVRRGECFANFVRKEQSSFSWDWGPAFGTMAINEMVLLRFVEKFTVDVSSTIHPESLSSSTAVENWIVSNKVSISQLEASYSKNGLFEISIPELGFTERRDLSLESYKSEIDLPITISSSLYDIQMWFPNGYGQQKLYNIEVRITIAASTILIKKRLGFRSVELVQDEMPGENNGLSFYFVINRLPIFLKGSNWIPASSFKENVTEEYLQWLMFSARDSHMNIMRVWGGGVYEPKRFYELADEYGIMIWQDFMFACATYPTNQDFMENVEKEIVHQVLRLREYPSIVLWAGNNENEALVGNNWFGTNSDRELYEVDYRKLYIDLIQTVLNNLDPEISRPYISSSPTNGKQTAIENPNWVSSNPQDVKYGDMHFYDYYMDSWEPSSWPVPRLASEYGIQAFPSFGTLLQVYDKADLSFESALTDHRQHHVDGNDQIEHQINYHTRSVKLRDPIENFKQVIYLSQVNQAMSLKVYNELLRRSRDTFNETTGIGHTMGAMYWQFNDIWIAPTWSAIEYGGKWKIGHYYSKRSFSPILISPSFDLNTKSLNVHVISDLSEESFSDDIIVKVFSYESLTPKSVKTVSRVVVPSLKSTLAFTWTLNSIKQETGCEYNTSMSCIITFTFANSQKYTDGENSIFLNNYLHNVENLKVPKVEILSIQRDTDTQFTLKLHTTEVALFVWLDLDTKILGRFSDNGFHMTSAEREVKLEVQKSGVSVEDIRQNLEHMNTNYYLYSGYNCIRILYIHI